MEIQWERIFCRSFPQQSMENCRRKGHRCWSLENLEKERNSDGTVYAKLS